MLDHARRDVCEQRPIIPEMNAHAIGMRSGEVLPRLGEGESGAGALDAESVNQVARREIPDADDGIHRRGNDPAAIVREAEVDDLAPAAPELADQLLRFRVDDADGEVVAAERDQVAGFVVSRGCDRDGHCGATTTPVDLVFQTTGVEVPELDLAVEAAADDRSVEGVDHQARHCFPVLSFPGAEAVRGE